MLHLPPDLNIPQRMFPDGVWKNLMRNREGAAVVAVAAVSAVGVVTAADAPVGMAAAPVNTRAVAATVARVRVDMGPPRRVVVMTLLACGSLRHPLLTSGRTRVGN